MARLPRNKRVDRLIAEFHRRVIAHAGRTKKARQCLACKNDVML